MKASTNGLPVWGSEMPSLSVYSCIFPQMTDNLDGDDPPIEQPSNDDMPQSTPLGPLPPQDAKQRTRRQRLAEALTERRGGLRWRQSSDVR